MIRPSTHNCSSRIRKAGTDAFNGVAFLYPTFDRSTGYGVDELKSNALLPVMISDCTAQKISRAELTAKVFPVLLFPNIQVFGSSFRWRSEADVSRTSKVRSEFIRKVLS